MDPITHGLIGSSASQVFASKDKMRAAAFAGFASAMMPDLDVLIGHSNDPLLNLEFHRQFTHAFVFIPVGALAAAVLIWWFVRKKLGFKETYLFSLLGYATAGVADTFTSYGVQLLWPFSENRFAWNIISVFDPLFTLMLVVALGSALYKKDKIYTWAAFGWMTIYLLFGLMQREKSKAAALELAQQRNHPVEQLIVKPTIANELLWSIRYTSGDSLYAYGVRLMPFTEPLIYQGDASALLSWREQFAHLKGTTLFRDIKRFATLSNDILIAHPTRDYVIGDGRYSMLPTSMEPLWGIEFDPEHPARHVDFRTFREASPEIRESFKSMLLGQHK